MQCSVASLGAMQPAPLSQEAGKAVLAEALPSWAHEQPVDVWAAKALCLMGPDLFLPGSWQVKALVCAAPHRAASPRRPAVEWQTAAAGYRVRGPWHL